MKLILIGDPHLKISRFELSKQFLEWVNKVILEKKPDLVVNLGDTFDTHAVVRSEILQEFKRHVQTITSNNIPYYYILGNHDMYKPNDNRYHALQPFMDNMKGFTVVERISTLDNITFVPYQTDITTFPKETKPIVICHQTFFGADYGYVRPDEGVYPEQISADIIVSGHIHMRQMFGKVIYPGTPYAQSANDVDQVKGLMLFDTDTYKYEFIDCPLPQWKSTSYDLSEYTADNIKNFIVNDIENSKDNWIVDITGPRAEYLSIRDSKDIQQLCSNHNIRFNPHYTDNEKKKVSIKSFSMTDITNEYIDKIYAGSIDKEILKKEAANIYNQISQLDSKLKL